MCPCNPAHIQNHFLHHFGLEMTGCVRRPVSKLLEHLKVLEELRNEVRRTQQLLLSSSFYRVFFYLYRYNYFVSLIFPYFFSFNPGTIILFLPVIIGCFANFRNFSTIFFSVIAIITVTSFTFSPFYSSSLLSHIISLQLRYHLPVLHIPLLLPSLSS